MSLDIVLPRATNDAAKTLIDKINTVTEILPPGVDRRLFSTAVVVAANEVGKDVTVPSLLKAAFNCACLGLMPGSALKMAYFVPFKGKCTLVIGYQGYLELAFRNSFLKAAYAEVILRGEKFRHYVAGDSPHIEHDIPLDRDLTKDNVVGAYCVYSTQSGGYGVHVVGRKELNAVDTGKNVWASNYIAMCRKTPLRRAANLWQTAPSMKQAITLDEAAEREEEQPDISGLLESAKKPSFSLNDLPDTGSTTEPVGNAQQEYVPAQRAKQPATLARSEEEEFAAAARADAIRDGDAEPDEPKIGRGPGEILF